MNKQEKNQVIQELREKFDNSSFIYFTDASSMTVAQVNKLRRMCFQQGIEMTVVKNTLARKAPAKLIKEFRKDGKRPVLKAAYIDSDVFFGDEHLDTLIALKSKEELVGDIIMLLQSPAKHVNPTLAPAGSTIAATPKTLEERAS